MIICIAYVKSNLFLVLNAFLNFHEPQVLTFFIYLKNRTLKIESSKLSDKVEFYIGQVFMHALKGITSPFFCFIACLYTL